MRRARRFLACAAAAVVAAAFTRAEPPAIPDPVLTAPANAALVYWRAWNAMPSDLQAIVDEPFDGRDLGWTPGAEVNAALEKAQPAIEQVLAATAIPTCDWGIDHTAGLGRDLGHLDKLRRTSRVLVSDARRSLAAGDADRSISRTVALLRMSLHTRGDGAVASSSVGQGFAWMAADEIERYATAGVLTDARRAVLREALKPALGDDAFAYAAAVRVEGAIIRHHLVSRYNTPDAGERFLRDFQQGGEPDDAYKQIRVFDAAGLKAAAERAETYFARVANAWNMPGAGEAIGKLEEGVIKGEFGAVALLIAPRYSEALHASADGAEKLRAAARVLDPGSPAAPPR